MIKWFIFYVTLLIAMLINGYFGIGWIYAEAINMFGLSVLCFAIAYEEYLKKKKK